MTPKKAAEKWNKQKRTTVRTVNRWIDEGRIPYTVEDGVKVIPDIKRPHIIRRDIRLTDKKVRDHILDATNHLEYIDANAFLGNLRDYEFAAHIIDLENEGKIKRMPNAPATADYKSNQWYIYNVGRQKEELRNEVIKEVATKSVSLTFNGINVDATLLKA